MGLDKSAITRLVKSGRWRRVMQQAYLVGGSPLTWRARLAATQASIGRDCVFSHRTAGALLGLDGITEGTVEVSLPREVTRPNVVVHCLRPSDSPRRIRVGGFPVTAPSCTIVDLFAVIDAAKAEIALDDALRRRLVSLDRLWRTYEGLATKGRNGCRALRNALLKRDHRDGTLATRMEAKLLSITRSIAPPQATPQYEVVVGQNRYYLDFAYADIKLGVEAHSIKWHMGEERWHYDLERDRRLKSSGWTLMYYSWGDLHRRPETVAAEIVAMRGRLEAHLF